jgi:hypothetical protein
MRHAERLVADWNQRHPVGTRVTLPLAPEEAPTVTTGAAFVDRRGPWVTWPVVTLDGFDHPVKLSWLQPEAGA